MANYVSQPKKNKNLILYDGKMSLKSKHRDRYRERCESKMKLEALDYYTK